MSPDTRPITVAMAGLCALAALATACGATASPAQTAPDANRNRLARFNSDGSLDTGYSPNFAGTVNEMTMAGLTGMMITGTVAQRVSDDPAFGNPPRRPR